MPVRTDLQTNTSRTITAEGAFTRLQCVRALAYLCNVADIVHGVILQMTWSKPYLDHLGYILYQGWEAIRETQRCLWVSVS